ncbi:MAG: ATP-binding protein [Comamonas sp.]
MRTPLSALVLSLSALLLTACGTTGTSAPPSTPVRAADGSLVGPDGRSLYTFAKDEKGSGTSACYEQCAVNWPPLAVSPSAKPMGDFSIIVRRDNARQWAYKGQPLYYFVKDSKAGDKTGDGVGGNWKLARP